VNIDEDVDFGDDNLMDQGVAEEPLIMPLPIISPEALLLLRAQAEEAVDERIAAMRKIVWLEEKCTKFMEMHGKAKEKLKLTESKFAENKTKLSKETAKTKYMEEQILARDVELNTRRLTIQDLNEKLQTGANELGESKLLVISLNENMSKLNDQKSLLESKLTTKSDEKAAHEMEMQIFKSQFLENEKSFQRDLAANHATIRELEEKYLKLQGEMETLNLVFFNNSETCRND
jgi:predicted  nucleic acid-binding Zn-ribbon protein